MGTAGSTTCRGATDAAEHARLRAVEGLDVDAETMGGEGAPPMFMHSDPDGNTVVVVDAPPA